MGLDRMSFETTPPGEKCIGLGHDSYELLSKIECETYIAFLLRNFPRIPEGCRFKITSNPHDFGTYRDVELFYNEDNKKHAAYAYKLDAKIPDKWDAEALKRLMSFPEYNHWMLYPKTPYVEQAEIPELNFELQAAIKVVEQAGGLVMLNEPEIEVVEREPMDTFKSVEELAKDSGMDVDLFILEYAFDDVVPACCKYGCDTEPDGHCQHGNESILLSQGMC